MSTHHSAPPPSLLRRIPLALGAFFGLLFSADLAARYLGLSEAPAAPPAPQPAPAAAPAPVVAVPQPAPQPAPAPAVVLKEATPDAALQLLGLLPREARLIDFCEEDLTGHADADIGAAARVVHAGCRKVLREHFTLQPVRSEAEGSRVTLPAGFDASAVKLTGQVVGQPPFTGTLSHRGWQAAEVRLPKLAPQHDAAVIAQAEVEL
jgi:hypothetical protein